MLAGRSCPQPLRRPGSRWPWAWPRSDVCWARTSSRPIRSRRSTTRPWTASRCGPPISPGPAPEPGHAAPRRRVAGGQPGDSGGRRGSGGRDLDGGDDARRAPTPCFASRRPSLPGARPCRRSARPSRDCSCVARRRRPSGADGGALRDRARPCRAGSARVAGPLAHPLRAPAAAVRARDGRRAARSARGSAGGRDTRHQHADDLGARSLRGCGGRARRAGRRRRRRDACGGRRGARGVEIAIVCGGVSVGVHDHVRPSLAELGVKEELWGLALRPGSPAWFGRRGATLVFGLPGNPVSAHGHVRAAGRTGAARDAADVRSPNRYRRRWTAATRSPPGARTPCGARSTPTSTACTRRRPGRRARTCSARCSVRTGWR